MCTLITLENIRCTVPTKRPKCGLMWLNIIDIFTIQPVNDAQRNKSFLSKDFGLLLDRFFTVCTFAITTIKSTSKPRATSKLQRKRLIVLFLTQFTKKSVVSFAKQNEKKIFWGWMDLFIEDESF